MRAVIQRVKTAKVEMNGQVTGQIGVGLLVFLGVEQGDAQADLDYICAKVEGLRVFEDGEKKMNRSVREASGALLVVSQFTLLGDARHGRRPSFSGAADPAEGERWYEAAVAAWRGMGLSVQTGVFRAEMDVSLVNDGPVTILLDSRRLF